MEMKGVSQTQKKPRVAIRGEENGSHCLYAAQFLGRRPLQSHSGEYGPRGAESYLPSFLAILEQFHMKGHWGREASRQGGQVLLCEARQIFCRAVQRRVGQSWMVGEGEHFQDGYLYVFDMLKILHTHLQVHVYNELGKQLNKLTSANKPPGMCIRNSQNQLRNQNTRGFNCKNIIGFCCSHNATSWSCHGASMASIGTLKVQIGHKLKGS